MPVTQGNRVIRQGRVWGGLESDVFRVFRRRKPRVLVGRLFTFMFA